MGRAGPPRYPCRMDLALEPLRPADRDRLIELCRACTDFFELIEGRPGGAESADELLGPLPPHVTSGAKRGFLLVHGDALVGVAELLEGYPAPREWYVGLLLLRPEYRTGGRGTAAWQLLRRHMEERGATLIRLVVQEQNARARGFWERQGFALETEVRARTGALEGPAWRMRLPL